MVCVLQLLQDSQNSAYNACYGEWHFRPRMGNLGVAQVIARSNFFEILVDFSLLLFNTGGAIGYGIMRFRMPVAMSGNFFRPNPSNKWKLSADDMR